MTGKAATTQDDVHFLRTFLKNQPEPRIYGSVHRFDKNPSNDSSQYTFMEGIKVIAQSGKKRFVTVTNKNGLYSFNKLPNGKYKVYPELPSKYVRNSWVYDLEEINLKSANDPFDFSDDFKIVNGPNVYSKIQIQIKP